MPMMMESKTIRLNDDALMEIFVKLPPMLLFRFKSVSPEWRDLISSSAFLRHYAAAHRRSTGGGLVAFFQRLGVKKDTEDPMAAGRCNTLPICNRLENYMHVPEHVGLFLDSSNGLILCRRGRVNVTYYVGNPLTGKFVKLPQPPQGKGLLEIRGQSNSGAHDMTRPEEVATALICEETTCNLEPVYTVLRAGLYVCRFGEQAKRIHIDSYSSKTGEWSPVTELVSTGRIELQYAPPVVANGIVHWYTTDGIAVYDPNNGDRRVQPIHTPYNNKYEADAVTRSADDDSVLWLAVLLRKKLLFYTLPKDVEASYKRGGGAEIHAKEWKLMEEFSTSISSISRLMKKGLIACKETKLECLIPDARSEVVAVLRQEKNVFLYNVHKKSIQKLEYSGSYNQCRMLHPYFYSYVLSSYCL